MSTFTPLTYLPQPDASALADAFVGQNINALRTPALLIDRAAFKRNCETVTGAVENLGMNFRAHIKTHKSPQGTKIQVESGSGVRRLVASTIPEIWGVIETGLIEEGKVDDILYSLPISPDRMEELTDAEEKARSLSPGFVVRVMVDSAEQVRALTAAAVKLNREAWSVFVKVDGGGKRAGAPPRSEQMKELIGALKEAKEVQVYGFYSHFGQSYASRGIQDAGKFYTGEIECVRDAAAFARELGLRGHWVLSVGATPTTQAAVHGAPGSPVGGDTLELHAGCYCLNDMQQEATGVSGELAVSVLATVVGGYPERDEVLCDAGALAVSKDTGPEPGFGRVVSHAGWRLGRVSQEHGVLTRTGEGDVIKYGERVRIVPNHACLACACHPWFYVVEGDEVVDVWVPWKGW